ncbi:Uncharacterised protein [Enterobacter hormaechei]|nr:Uncharacterised protein [Enterobacter hormaechei]
MVVVSDAGSASPTGTLSTWYTFVRSLLSIICTGVRTLTSRDIRTIVAIQPSMSIMLWRRSQETATTSTESAVTIRRMMAQLSVFMKVTIAFSVWLSQSPPAITYMACISVPLRSDSCSDSAEACGPKPAGACSSSGGQRPAARPAAPAPAPGRTQSAAWLR